METRLPMDIHRKVSAPEGPPLRPGETSPAQVRAWRRERIGYCVASLLRDRAVAMAVARGLTATRAGVASETDDVSDAAEGPLARVIWLVTAARRG